MKITSGQRLLVSLSLILSLAWGGCMFEDAPAVNVTMPADFGVQGEMVAENIPVDIYWDATYSMAGYTTLAAGNVFRTLPDELGDMGDSMGEVTFYRFGAEVTPMEGREWRNYTQPGVYTELITAVHNVVDKADANHLSVIVTDLFESDSDWSNVTKKLKDKYFGNHLAVAIIGVKNSFNGDIFDVGLNAAKYTYNSGDNPARFRPFYLFIMGPEKGVRDFIDRWRERKTLPNETNYLFLSENLTESAGDFSKLELLPESENLYEKDGLGLKDKRMKEFGITDMGDPVKLAAKFAYQPIFGTCPLDMDNLKTSVQVLKLTEEGWQKSEREGDANAEVVHAEDDNYQVTLTFSPELTLEPESVNFIHVSVAPDSKGYKLPDWVKQWNMPNVDVSPTDFDGSKTINFLHVADSLKGSALAASHPSLVNLNMVIDNR